jgi:hypothetical protein
MILKTSKMALFSSKIRIMDHQFYRDFKSRRLLDCFKETVDSPELSPGRLWDQECETPLPTNHLLGSCSIQWPAIISFQELLLESPRPTNTLFI